MFENFTFWAITSFAIIWTGIAKSGFGGGLGMLAVLIMSLVMPPTKAAAILLPLLCVMDLFAVWHYRGKWHRANLKIMLPAAMVGIALGTQLFHYLSDAHIRIIIGIIAIVFVFSYLLKKRNGAAQSPSLVRGSFWSAVAGFTSFGVHAGGPPANVYLLPQQLEKSVFIATTVLFFTIVNYVKLIPYAYLGQLNVSNLSISLVLGPLAPLGIFLGVKLQEQINEGLFYKFCYAFLFVTGTKLLYDGFSGL